MTEGHGYKNLNDINVRKDIKKYDQNQEMIHKAEEVEMAKKEKELAKSEKKMESEVIEDKLEKDEPKGGKEEPTKLENEEK